MRRIGTLVITAGLAFSAPALAQDGLFNLGNLVVSQMGDGTAALGSTGTITSLREFSLATGFVGMDSVTMPTSVVGANRRLVGSGSATGDGHLTFSPDGLTLCYQGYDAALGTTGVAASAPGTVNRVVAAVGLNLSVDTSTAWSDATGNIRSSIITNSIAYGGTSGAGVRSGPFAFAGPSAAESGTLLNSRVVNSVGGSLYASSASGLFVGINLISGGTASLVIPTASGTGTPSPYDFLFTSSTTCYVADDRTLVNGGGLQKWTNTGSGWSLAYTLTTGLSTGLRSLTVDPATGTIYAISADTLSKILSISDTGAASSFTTLATATTNTAFRGIEFVTVPTPGSMALMSLGGLALVRRRRR